MEVDTPNTKECEVVTEIEQKIDQENQDICPQNPTEVLSTQETLCIRKEPTINTFQTTETSKDNNNNNHDTWTTREKLLLISFALVNGDSNWSYVCDQLNKLNPNSFIKKKTSAQCSKQYRQIINNFLNKSKDCNAKNQLIDLKKIYNELAEERLNEVNTQFQQFKDEYTHKSNEILYYLDLNLESNENSIAANNCDEPKFDSNFKKMIIKWIDLNMDSKTYDIDDRYNETLIQALRECQNKQSNQINLQLIDALERDAEKKREYDEKLRLAELERIEKERLEREAAVQLEKLRLEEEQRIRLQKELEEELERQRIETEKKEQEEEERLRLEQEQKEKELKLLDELKPEIPENIDESSKESSKFSSEDEIPLLNIIQSRGLLNDKMKSPSPSVSETAKMKQIKTRRSLRKSIASKNEDENLVSSASSVSSVASQSSISHKSVSVSCSSISEQDEHKHNVEHDKNIVKASVSTTSSIYDNLDADDNQDIFSKKKLKKHEELINSDNLVQISIKQEPSEGPNEPESSQSKAINTSTSSSSSSSSKTNEDEKAYRAWKKSIMMILNNVSCHKHATIFMHPVKDEIAPGYSTLIHRPIDLSTIKKNLENGSVRTTKEFQRDIMLMFTNALMYNSSNHNIHKIALEMFKEVLGDIEQLLNAQEGMSENLENLYLNKPLRFKDMRTSSMGSDGKASSIISNLNQIEAQNDDSVNSLLKKNSKTKDAKNTSKSSLKDESLNDNSSIKSNSSVSTPRQSTGRSRVNSSKTTVKTPKVESKIETKKEEPSNPKKRKPSGNTSTTNLNTSGSNSHNNNKEQSELDTSEVLSEPPKSKRRKSGR